MNGRIARRLRKVMGFNPHEERYYNIINNANNFALNASGTVERVGGTIIEVNKNGDLVTKRSKYKYMKEQYYNGAF